MFYNKSGKLMYFYIKKITLTDEVYLIFNKPEKGKKTFFCSRKLKKGDRVHNEKAIEFIVKYSLSSVKNNKIIYNKLMESVREKASNELNFIGFKSNLLQNQTENRIVFKLQICNLRNIVHKNKKQPEGKAKRNLFSTNQQPKKNKSKPADGGCKN